MLVAIVCNAQCAPKFVFFLLKVSAVRSSELGSADDPKRIVVQEFLVALIETLKFAASASRLLEVSASGPLH